MGNTEPIAIVEFKPPRYIVAPEGDANPYGPVFYDMDSAIEMKQYRESRYGRHSIWVNMGGEWSCVDGDEFDWKYVQ